MDRQCLLARLIKMDEEFQAKEEAVVGKERKEDIDSSKFSVEKEKEKKGDVTYCT